MVDNYLTVDVEEYFEEAPSAGTSELELRLELQIDNCLSLLERTASRATFFFVAIRAARYPHLVHRIIGSGHEIASHGCVHDFFYALPFEQQIVQVKDSKKILEDIAGQAVVGFRAPFFSIIRKNASLLKIIAGAGYEYDSSVFPGSHPRYGWPDASATPYLIRICDNLSLLELPPTTVKLLFWRIGLGGGAYLRILPQWMTMKALRKTAARNIPLVLYFHPWELDPEQPRLSLGASFAFRHYSGLKTTEQRLGRILSEFRFTNCSCALSQKYDTVSLP